MIDLLRVSRGRRAAKTCPRSRAAAPAQAPTARQSAHRPLNTTAAPSAANPSRPASVIIAYVRKRFLDVSWRSSLLQVTLGGALVTSVGFLIGHA